MKIAIAITAFLIVIELITSTSFGRKIVSVLFKEIEKFFFAQETIKSLIDKSKIIEKEIYLYKSKLKSNDDKFWDGVKYGFSLRSKENKNQKIKLTKEQLMCLEDINNNAHSFDNVSLAVLEEQGYISSYKHYKITNEGRRRLQGRS